MPLIFLSMPTSAGYEPLPQHAEEDEAVNGGDHAQTVKPSRRQALKRPYKPGHIDLSKLDNAFKRYVVGFLQGHDLTVS